MITNLQQLYDHANRYWTIGRLNGVEGKINLYSHGLVALTSDDDRHARVVIRDAELEKLELREPGPNGKFIPLAEYDDEAAAAQMQRWEARAAYDISLKNTTEALARYEEDLNALHPDDLSAALDQHGAPRNWRALESGHDLSTAWPEDDQ